jgi:hypothetical protein
MRIKKHLITLIFIFLPLGFNLAQIEEEEQILYFQMEPLDDSLFLKIQSEVFIEPPDPKAEIITDLRDPNNQTVSIKGALYPFLAFTPETRAKIIAYPFKLNLEEDLHYGSVFSRVFEKMRFGKIISPPTLNQISPTLWYINPFFQAFGGERFGLPIKNDIGISFGIGTPYSGVLETNFIEGNFHILGVYGGAFGKINELLQIKQNNNHNNLYVTAGYQLGYVIPFGNFLQVSYQNIFKDATVKDSSEFLKFNTENYKAKVLSGSYFNWEFRYPIGIMGSTRGKFYVARYLNEWHVGYSGRELSFAGSTFDLRFDALTHSDVRLPQYAIDILIQKIGQSWAFSAFALGPSVVLAKDEGGKFGIISFFANFRLKVGTSL